MFLFPVQFLGHLEDSFAVLILIYNLFELVLAIITIPSQL